MRFCANVSILFKEISLLERFGRAAEAGFSAVEFWWPMGEDLGAVERAIKDAGLTVALFNFGAGDMPAGDRGLVSDPEREGQFRENVPVALELARSLGCRKMNVLAGHEIEGMSREEQLELARENVRFAADEAEEYGVEVMVEAAYGFNLHKATTHLPSKLSGGGTQNPKTGTKTAQPTLPYLTRSQ